MFCNRQQFISVSLCSSGTVFKVSLNDRLVFLKQGDFKDVALSKGEYGDLVQLCLTDVLVIFLGVIYRYLNGDFKDLICGILGEYGCVPAEISDS